jgi:integrase
MGTAATLKVRNLVFSSGERFPALIDTTTGSPDFDATHYLSSRLRTRNLAALTLHSAARSIMVGYQVLELLGVEINDRLANDRFLTLGEIDDFVNRFSWTQEHLRGELSQKREPQALNHKAKVCNLESVRKSAPKKLSAPTVCDDTAATRLLYFRDFLKWKVDAKLLSLSPNDVRHFSLRQEVDIVVNAINARIPRSSAKNDRDAPQGLSDIETQLLLEVVELESPLNPWKSHFVRVRNRLLVQVLLNLGPRKGEVLGLKVEDINFRTNELTIHRRADDVLDPRRVQPNAKTKSRVLPLHSELARGLHRYLKYRENTHKAKFHPFLFVANGSGSPMSISALDRVFQDIKESQPGKFERLSPHIPRHTWNDKFSEVMDETGVDKGDEEKARSYSMGWEPGSGTVSVYSRRHTKKKANEASLKLQARYAKFTAINE